ncbi:Uncharacterized conserved protein, DUF302 family [Hydrobacter penzbergensis]|jgi:uncharacterized protein (DUF302 family)|uniref:Uncharacterized conserved protein, DUF302 family n=1 Tax=Hydrobacter penzbergensis TaxID=1235997 RepID=A0A8X8IEF4_9BACT|nr:DUF302 domain-containing protein [Hydrobacter penzbergensis]MBN8717976.1 DUF302 domain-containing protein [Sediminibacterium magnilacihabitans]PQV61570.1 uncharacterized protein (DUF302 family) [Sediminibacterium magnilacihabitans]SDW15065.1 Uncharacterized conserved protein, DUF302 family [Hydrobacter penzbergensis]
MDYTISKKVNKNFIAAVDAVTGELKKEGFGVITEIDLKEKLKEKLGVDFRNYKILGACNPALAHKAVQLEDKIGVMLPCNILIQEKQNGEVEVSAINPLNSIGGVENEALHSIAEEVSGKLQNVIDRI